VKRDRLTSSALLIAGLVLALLGQLYFTYRREFWRDGILFWIVSLSLFWLLWRRLRRREDAKIRADRRWSSQALSWAVRNPWRVLAFGGGMGLSLLAGWQANRLPAGANFVGAFGMWVTGVMGFLLAFVPAVSGRRTLTNVGWRLYRQRLELLGLAVLLLIALLVRTVNLDNIPVNLGGDEGTWGNEARAMLAGGVLSNPFTTRWLGFPSLAFLILGAAMRIFGETVAGLRTLSALTGTASILTTFLLARELWGKRVAWSAAALLAFGHYHMHYSRLVFNNVTDSLLVTLALYLVVRGLRSRRTVYFALTGAVMGLGWYEYFGARLVNVIVLIYMLWRGVVDYRFKRAWWKFLATLLAVVLVVVAPLLFHYLANPADFSAGWQRVSIAKPEWFVQEQEYFGIGPLAVIWRQIWKSISAFHYTLDPTFHYHASIPLLDFVSGVLFLFGLVWAVAHWRERGAGLLLVWFWLALIMGWILTENPPSSQRMVIIAPAVALLIGLGLSWLAELGRRALGGTRLPGWNEIATATLAAIAILNLHYYFVVYTPTGVYGNPTAEVATVLGRYLQQRDDDYLVYFYGPPAMYADIGNLAFLAPDSTRVDVREGEEQPSALADSRGARFVFLPHRLEELDAIRAKFPAGQEKRVHSRVDGRLLYALYEVESR
jgi:4-amino-4-deoxy-L-arabinose transferase-like glycosyltransferase